MMLTTASRICCFINGIALGTICELQEPLVASTSSLIDRGMVKQRSNCLDILCAYNQ